MKPQANDNDAAPPAVMNQCMVLAEEILEMAERGSPLGRTYEYSTVFDVLDKKYLPGSYLEAGPYLVEISFKIVAVDPT